MSFHITAENIKEVLTEAMDVLEQESFDLTATVIRIDKVIEGIAELYEELGDDKE